MTKEINKIVGVIGFIVMVVGMIIDGVDSLQGSVAFSTAAIAAVLATAFIFAHNATVKNVGYLLCALIGAYGVALIATTYSTGLIIAAIGMLMLFFASVLYFFVITLKFFGFVKDGKGTTCGNISDVLIRYKAMQEEKVISEEEFNELKKRTLETNNETGVGFDDLKKWKKLLDQQVITEEEFSAIKAKVFQK